MKKIKYHGKELLSSFCEINFLELKKVPEKWYNDREMWSLFLATDNEDVIDMLAKENKDIGKAVEKLKYVTEDDKERFRIDQIEKGRMDYYSAMKSNYTKGKEEGKIEVAKQLLSKFNDIEISEMTGLDIDVIAGMRE